MRISHGSANANANLGVAHFVRYFSAYVDQGETHMSIIVWIVLGLIAGWLAGQVMGPGGYGVLGDIILGIIGALIGGFLSSLLFGIAVTGLNLTSIIIAIIGAIIFIAILRALVPGTRSHV